MLISRVSVFLDGETSDPRFTLSEDRTSRTWDANAQLTPEQKQHKLDSWAIWARDGLESGKHYWEVSAGPETAWTVGVSQHTIPISRFHRPSVKVGFWVMMLWNIKGTRVQVRKLGTTMLLAPLNKLGVYVDFIDGRISFYNPDGGAHLHTFKAELTGKVYPVFQLWASTRPDGTISIV
ncbi:hypothetical protein chiPu_0007878 [Chiloscyllium punctatum]|uniref:B30.2/SPRY domain-containing protein n=1 Tax=Chiloscyllium punctatum TaxID=137246 RepID=A0A401SG92_CHIPU|nr:hypothetical protein [Chiloscyllium punctatum]